MVVLLGRRILLKGLVICLSGALGAYTSGFLVDWQMPMGFDAAAPAQRVAAELDVWTDGSLVEDKVSGISSSGSFFFTDRTGHLLASRGWDHLDDDLGTDMANGSFRGFCSVPGPLQSVQRADFLGGGILALQAADGIHLGVDNTGVVRHVGRLLEGNAGSRPAELVKDGDLILLIGKMLRLRGLDTVRISEVKGHADEGMVLDGRIREIDRLGNDAADVLDRFGVRFFLVGFVGRPMVMVVYFGIVPFLLLLRFVKS